MSKVIVPIVIMTLLPGACSSMSNKEQRMLSGSAMGAGTGLLIGGPVGASWEAASGPVEVTPMTSIRNLQANLRTGRNLCLKMAATQRR